MSPPSQTAFPAMLWPPPRIESRSRCSRATLTARMTSAVPAARMTAAGRLSIIAFQIVRACSYPGSPGRQSAPRSWLRRESRTSSVGAQVVPSLPSKVTLVIGVSSLKPLVVRSDGRPRRRSADSSRVKDRGRDVEEPRASNSSEPQSHRAVAPPRPLGGSRSRPFRPLGTPPPRQSAPHRAPAAAAAGQLHATSRRSRRIRLGRARRSGPAGRDSPPPFQCGRRPAGRDSPPAFQCGRRVAWVRHASVDQRRL